MKKWLCKLVVVLAVAGSASAADRALDYAAEDAAVSAIKAFKKSGVVSGAIAMLPLEGDRDNLYPVIRAELSRYPALYSFYVRDDADWNKLLSEVEFGERKGDVMNAESIQKFGSVEGVDALLYGSVREATAQNGDAVVRLTLTLADVETGKQIWTGNVDGEYTQMKYPQGNRLTATVNAAKAGKAEFDAAKAGFGEVDIYFVPAVAGGVDYTDFIRTEFVKATGGNIQFFADLGELKGRRMAMSLARDFGEGNVSVPELANLMKQLEGLGYVASGGKDVSAAPVRKKALLLARFGGMEEVKDINLTNVDLNLQLVRLEDGNQLWGANVSGSAVDVKGFLPLVKKNWKFVLIVGAAVIILGMFLKAVSRPR